MHHSSGAPSCWPPNDSRDRLLHTFARQARLHTRHVASAFAIGASLPGHAFPVPLQTVQIGKKLFLPNVALLVIGQPDSPVGHGHCLHLLPNLALCADLHAILITTENIHSCVRGVLEYTQRTAVGQPTPDQLSIPSATVSSLGKAQPALGKALHNGKGSTGFAE